MITMTTDTVLRGERAEYWADLVSTYVTPMRIEPTGERPLHGEVQSRLIGELGIAQVSGRGVRALHTRAQVARASGHLYAACIHLDGEACMHRRGEDMWLRRGDVFITDSRDEFMLNLDRPWRHLMITLPTDWLDRHLARPELASGAVLRDHPLVHLWATQLATGFAVADELSPAGAALFARHSIELLAQVIEESHYEHPTESDAWRAALYLEARQTIALRCGDPNLGPARIARDMNVSTRTLERIFAANGESIMRRVYDERVRQAAISLTAPQFADRSVTEIAFACGFNDASHFGRTFAANMGVTPSEWRRQKRGDREVRGLTFGSG